MNRLYSSGPNSPVHNNKTLYQYQPQQRSRSNTMVVCSSSSSSNIISPQIELFGDCNFCTPFNGDQNRNSRRNHLNSQSNLTNSPEHNSAIMVVVADDNNEKDEEKETNENDKKPVTSENKKQSNLTLNGDKLCLNPFKGKL